MTQDIRTQNSPGKQNARPAPRWQQYVPLLLGIVTLLGLVALLGRWGNDDPYITFRYASHVQSGHGMVYNIGERTLSTTAPLYALLLAGLGLVWPNLPALSGALSALSLVLGAVFLYLWARDRQERAVGLLSAVLVSLSPLLLGTLGAETCSYILLVLVGLYAYDRSHHRTAAVSLALAAMVRPDAVLAAAALGLYHIVKHRSILWQPILIYAGLVGAWYAGLWLYYGSPVPVTLAAKQKQAELAVSLRFEAGLLDLILGNARQPLFWLQGAVAAVGLVQVLTRARHWLPLILWTVLYVLAYALLGVSTYPWYFAPLVPAFAVLVAEGAVSLIRAVARTHLNRAIVTGLAVGLLIAVLVPVVGSAIGAVWNVDPRLDVYREIGEWLEEYTPEGATVGALEVGIIGYYGQRPIVDFAGLLQPQVAQRLGPDSSFLDSATWAIETYEPDYVVLHQPAFFAVSDSGWFQADYTAVREFTNQEALWLTLYQRSPSP